MTADAGVGARQQMNYRGEQRTEEWAHQAKQRRTSRMARRACYTLSLIAVALDNEHASPRRARARRGTGDRTRGASGRSARRSSAFASGHRRAPAMIHEKLLGVAKVDALTSEARVLSQGWWWCRLERL